MIFLHLFDILWSIDKNIFVMFSGFWPLRGGEGVRSGVGESDKNGKLVMKIVFPGYVERSSKDL